MPYFTKFPTFQCLILQVRHTVSTQYPFRFSFNHIFNQLQRKTDKSRGNNLPFLDKSWGNNSVILDKSWGNNSVISDKSWGNNSVISDKSRGNNVT